MTCSTMIVKIINMNKLKNITDTLSAKFYKNFDRAVRKLYEGMDTGLMLSADRSVYARPSRLGDMHLVMNTQLKEELDFYSLLSLNLLTYETI